MDANPSSSPTSPTATTPAVWHLGTIGFSYADWAGPFYPESSKSTQWLSYYSRHFNSVEMDTTFYATPPKERVEKWRDATPDGFQFCVKTPKAITHDAVLPAGVDEMRRFVEACSHFQSKLGAILIQLAPTFTADRFAEVDTFLAKLPDGFRYAVEFRHRSWGTPQTLKMVNAHGVSFVSAEYASKPSRIFATADFLYLRWIGVHDRYPKHEKELGDVSDSLAWWQTALEPVTPRVADVYGFFNNDYAGYAPATANRFKGMLGLPVNEPTEGKTFSLFE